MPSNFYYQPGIFYSRTDAAGRPVRGSGYRYASSSKGSAFVLSSKQYESQKKIAEERERKEKEKRDKKEIERSGTRALGSSKKTSLSEKPLSKSSTRGLANQKSRTVSNDDVSFLFDKDGNITDEAYNEINEKGVEGLVDYVNRETGSSYTLSTKEADSRRGIANQKEINRIYSPVNSVSRDEVLNALNDISVEDILTVITNERNTRELFENIGNVAVASVSFNVATVTESNAGGGGTGGGGTSGGDDTGETTSGTTEPPPGYTPNGGTTGGTTYGY